jgi:hypothetical protein
MEAGFCKKKKNLGGDGSFDKFLGQFIGKVFASAHLRARGTAHLLRTH